MRNEGCVPNFWVKWLSRDIHCSIMPGNRSYPYDSNGPQVIGNVSNNTRSSEYNNPNYPTGYRELRVLYDPLSHSITD